MYVCVCVLYYNTRARLCRDFSVLVTVVFDQVAQERWQEHGTQAAARYGHSVGESAIFDEVRCHDKYSWWKRKTRTAAKHHAVAKTERKVKYIFVFIDLDTAILINKY